MESTGDAPGAGPDFTDALETSSVAFTFSEAGGSSVTLKGPDHADIPDRDDDDSEPYLWTPDNDSDIDNWVDGLGTGDISLRLDDGEDVAPPEPLALSDFDDSGLEVVVKALIEAANRSESGGVTLYNNSPRWTAAGTLLDGELGFDDSNSIRRIQYLANYRGRSGALRFNDDYDPLHLGNFFSAGGAGHDLTIYLQTDDGVFSFDVDGTSVIVRHGAHYINFDGPAEIDTALAGISEGNRFIIALARPVVERNASVSAEAGSPTVEIRAERQLPTTNRDVSFSARAGTPAASVRADKQSVRNRDASFAARSGDPEVSMDADSRRVETRDASLQATGGVPEVSIEAESGAVPVRDAGLQARAGSPMARVRGQAVQVRTRNARLSSRAGLPTVEIAVTSFDPRRASARIRAAGLREWRHRVFQAIRARGVKSAEGGKGRATPFRGWGTLGTDKAFRTSDRFWKEGFDSVPPDRRPPRP